MLSTVASYTGGVDKTTTAVHLAANLQTLAPTLRLAGNDIRNATARSLRGKDFPFTVADEVQAARYGRDFTHSVIDTGQRPKQVDGHALSDGCQLPIIPTVPASLDTDSLVLMLQALQDIGNERYRVLLTQVPPPPAPQPREEACMMPGVDQGGQEEEEAGRLCPKCQSIRIFRSRRHGLVEWLLRIIRLFPFRCDRCGHRFRRVTWRGR